MRKLALFTIVFAVSAFPQSNPGTTKPSEQPEQTQKKDETKPLPIDTREPGIDMSGATVEVGVQAVTVDGEKTFGFQQYRDVPQGAFLRSFDYFHVTDGKPFRFSIHALDVIQRDMLIHADVENAARFHIQANYEGISRFWGNHGRSVLTEVQRGVFVAPLALRTDRKSVV